MFSRKPLALSLAITASLFIGGCDLPLNEEPVPPKDIEVPLGDSKGCLSKVIPVLENYFDGKAQVPEIEATWDCVGKALGTFEKSVVGRYEDRFTARELVHFVEQYFLDDGEKISDSLMTEIFRIKQLFVGGSVDFISRKEMKNLETVVGELKAITVELNPHMDIFSMNWQPTRELREPDLEKFEKANEGIQKGAKQLALIIERNGMPYDISHFSILLKELSTLSSSGWAWTGDLEKAIPLVKKLKKSLAGGDENLIAPNEWRRFALLGARGFVQYLRFHYFIKKAHLSAGGAHLAYMVRSIDDLFSYLSDMVEGKPNQTLTRQEIFEIADSLTALMPSLKVSELLVLEFMRIKVVFFGGRLDSFVKDDFETARAKLEEFRQITQKFLDYRDVFGLDWKTVGLSYSQLLSRFKLAEKNILEVAQRLGQIMETKYDLNNLLVLAEEIERLYPTANVDETPLNSLAQQYVPILVSVKNIIFSDHSSFVGDSPIMSVKNQWSEFLNYGAQFFNRYLTYYYFLKGNEIENTNVLLGTERLVYDSVAILEKILKGKPTQIINWQELENLSAALAKTKLLPQLVTKETLYKAMGTIVNKILLNPEDRLAGVKPEGFNLQSLQILKSEFSLWVENQKFYEISYLGILPNAGRSGEDILADLERMTPTVAGIELKMVFSGKLPMSYDSGGRLYLASPPQNYLKKTATIFNIVRSGARLLIRSFAQDINRIKGYVGISEQETQDLYAEIHNLLSEFELVHPKNFNFGLHRFRDAGLFTDVGDGDGFASFSEISHLFMMIISGIKTDNLIFDPIDQNKLCPVNKYGSLFKDDWHTSVACITEVYYTEMRNHFLGLPDFMDYQDRLDRSRFDKMFMSLLIAAGYRETSGDDLIVGDLSLVPHTMQYIETYFQIYDVNRNGIIEAAEGLKSYPRFEATLKKVGEKEGLKTEKQLKGLLTWMLRYGKPPKELEEKLLFKGWWLSIGESGWKTAAERDQLASILGYISKALEEAGEEKRP